MKKFNIGEFEDLEHDSSFLRTRSGNEVYIYTTESKKGGFPILGAVYLDKRWIDVYWNIDGRVYETIDTLYDLFIVDDPMADIVEGNSKLLGWFVVFRDDQNLYRISEPYDTEEEAIEGANELAEGDLFPVLTVVQLSKNFKKKRKYKLRK